MTGYSVFRTATSTILAIQTYVRTTCTNQKTREGMAPMQQHGEYYEKSKRREEGRKGKCWLLVLLLHSVLRTSYEHYSVRRDGRTPQHQVATRMCLQRSQRAWSPTTVSLVFSFSVSIHIPQPPSPSSLISSLSRQACKVLRTEVLALALPRTHSARKHKRRTAGERGEEDETTCGG